MNRPPASISATRPKCSHPGCNYRVHREPQRRLSNAWRAPPQPEAGLWRQCFHEAHWAATDSGITAAELVKTSWEFVFKGELDPARQEQAHTATFGADGTFVSTVPSAPSGRRPLKYHLCHRPAAPRIAASEDACRFVQVKGYPTLRVSRVGWRWRLENDMVVINEH